jgi:hypothetical protein
MLADLSKWAIACCAGKAKTKKTAPEGRNPGAAVEERFG